MNESYAAYEQRVWACIRVCVGGGISSREPLCVLCVECLCVHFCIAHSLIIKFALWRCAHRHWDVVLVAIAAHHFRTKHARYLFTYDARHSTHGTKRSAPCGAHTNRLADSDSVSHIKMLIYICFCVSHFIWCCMLYAMCVCVWICVCVNEYPTCLRDRATEEFSVYLLPGSARAAATRTLTRGYILMMTECTSNDLTGGARRDLEREATKRVENIMCVCVIACNISDRWWYFSVFMLYV